MSELKPCPFCGGRATVKTRYIGYGSIGLGEHDEYRVVCKECRASNDEYRRESEAIAAWNRRAQPANEPPVRCGERANYQTQNCAAKHEQALMDFCSHGIRKPGGEQDA